MYKYEIWYAPIWGQMTRYCEYVRASNEYQAIIKFYGTKSGGNCSEILIVERCY